jgi:superfamily I DNA and/or RNA helicase
MFSIANAIAYNNQMVRIDDNNISSPLPPSTWLDIRGITILEGHALHEELEAAKNLLQKLAAHEDKIFIISPFRSIAGACYNKFQKKGRIECGTIHTFQGRETDVVLLVLGTAQHSTKARNWVAATPNILNVAITRARHRLYVIGNRQTWGALPYFDHLAKTLPYAPITH